MYLTLPFALFVLGGEAPAYWDWQLTEPYDFSVRVEKLVLDADAPSSSDLAKLRERGVEPICYISVGTWEEYRSDAGDFPDAVLGNPLPDWPGERYVDVRAPALVAIMKARLDACAAKGFQGVEADNIDAFENNSGFGLTREDSLTYIRDLAAHAKRLGLSFGQKNATSLAADLAEELDFLMVESCFEYHFCDEVAPYLKLDKDVLAIEYEDAGLDWTAIRAEAKARGLHLLLKQREVSAGGKACTGAT